MAREITQIQNLIIADLAANGIVVTNNKFSVRRIWTYVVAVAIYTLEKLFDLFITEVNGIIDNKNPHTLRWYANKTKAFEYGYNLFGDTDTYNNTGLTDAQIADSKIIAYAAVVEQQRGLRIKVAKSVGADLGALLTPELNALKNYLAKVKDAGVKLNITTADADSLKMDIRIKYNPLVLNAIGGRVDGTVATPIKDAIKLHLKNLPFNGVFSVAKIMDTIQLVEGVEDVKIDTVQCMYGALAFTSVDIDYIPDSGYLRILDADLLINYLPA